MKKMKRVTIFILLIIFSFSCLQFIGCSNSDEEVVVSFIQENYDVVKRTVKKGERLASTDIPEPVQNDESYIYYWEKFENNNLTENITVRAKKYTKGLVFELGGAGYMVSRYSGTYPRVIVPDYYEGKPVVGLNDRAFDEDSLSYRDSTTGAWVNVYDPVLEATGNRIRFVELPSTIKTMGGAAFYENRLLEEIVIPDEVESLGWGTFFWCQSLKKITLPKNIKYIDSAAIDSTKITSLVIPDGTTELAKSAISFNPKLEYVVLPVSINKLGKNAICYDKSYCAKTKIYYKGTYADWSFIDVNMEETSAINPVIVGDVYYYSEEEPIDTSLKYWHYVDGVPQVW